MGSIHRTRLANGAAASMVIVQMFSPLGPVAAADDAPRSPRNHIALHCLI
jgi:hypothetical protein